MPTVGFRAPELKITDARIYPPEVTAGAQNRRFTVKYPFVALKAGNYKVALDLAVFDPEKGVYDLNKIALSYKVTANPEMAASAAPALPEEEKTVKAAPVSAELVPYPLAAPAGTVKLPLMRNTTPYLLIPAAVVAALLITIAASRKKSDPEKNQKRRKLKKIINEINSSGNAARPLLEAGSTEIAQALDIPAGASFSDIADTVEKDDRLLAQFFRQLEAGQFAPDSTLPAENELLRSRVTAFLKKLLIFVVISAGVTLSAVTFEDGKKAFDSGNYKESAKLFTQLIEENGADPAVYYDLGSSYCMLKNHTAAYLNFTRASLLAPANPHYRAAAEAAIIEAKDALEIKSPSRVGMRIGRDFIRGIAVGEEDEDAHLTATRRAMRDMIDVPFGAIRDTGTLSSYGGTPSIAAQFELTGSVEMDGYEVGRVVLRNFDDVAAQTLRGVNS